MAHRSSVDFVGELMSLERASQVLGHSTVDVTRRDLSRQCIRSITGYPAEHVKALAARRNREPAGSDLPECELVDRVLNQLLVEMDTCQLPYSRQLEQALRRGLELTLRSHRQ